MRIRRARPSEAKEIAEVLNVQFEKGRYSKAFLRKYLNTEAKIFNDMKSCEYFVIGDGRILGVISLRFLYKTCKIDDLAVRRKWQHRGLGTKLIAFAESYARKRKCHKIWCTTTAQLNATGFYEKLGFGVEGVLRKHFEGRDVIHLGKLL